jgi:multidrug efflux pump subunit AcrB
MRTRPGSLVIFAALALACTPHRDEPAPAPAVTPVVVPREPVTIEVVAEWPGQGALEIERALVVPLEQALRGVPDVTRIESRARAGRATLVLTLDARSDPGLGRTAVHERLGAARASLPEGAFTATGADLVDRASALVFALTPTTADSMQLHRAGEALREALYVIPGVGEVEICGGREPRLAVTLDAARLSAYHLSIPAVVKAVTDGLHGEPRMPAGVITVAASRSMSDLMAVLVAPGERPVALRDVASITVEPAIPDCDAARIGAGGALIGLVRARRGVDLPALEEAVHAELATKRSELATRGFTLDVFTAPPLRLLVDLSVGAEPNEALAAANRAIADELAGIGFASRTGFLRVTTAPQNDRDLDAELLLESAGLAAADIAALEQRLDRPGMRVRRRLGDPSSLRLWITGPELEADQRLAGEAATIVAKAPGVVRAAAYDPLAAGLVVGLQRERLARFGLPVADVVVTLAAAIDGAPAGEVQLDGARMPVIVRVGAKPRGPSELLEALRGLAIDLPAGGKVGLTELVDIKTGLEPATISRLDGRRAASVDITLVDPTPERRAQLQQTLARSLQLPVGHVAVWE